MNDLSFEPIQTIEMWTNQTLPTVFDDSLSYTEQVARLKGVVFELSKKVDALDKSNSELEAQYKAVLIKLEEIQKWIDEYMLGCKIPPHSITLEMFACDIQDMIAELVVKTVYDCAQFVSFGLDDDGYFVAFIPEHWKDIEFDTTDKGELMLRY